MENIIDGVGIQIRLVPEPPIPYAKADAFQVCRLDQTFALSCYQIDYQIVASWAQTQDASTPGVVDNIPPARLVARVVMDEQGFRRIRDELNRIFELSGLK
jgi:hypothetical protein